MAELLRVNRLKTQFKVDRNKIITAVDEVSFSMDEGETLAIVGESGSGKSVTALSIMRLVPSPPGKIVGGEIFFRGKNLLECTGEEMRSIRGNQISMIFQEPMTSLNPTYTVGNQISEALIWHQKLKKKEALEKTVEMLRLIDIPTPKERLKSYPHQLSGGMRQRVMIAMALCCDPGLLIADEPTTALDVTIQAQILELINKLKTERNMSVMLITHDLGVVADVATKIIVMYGGAVMETGKTYDMFKNPLHPYTKGLLSSIPRLDTPKSDKLFTIKGIVPDLSRLPKGCVFSTRCDSCEAVCRRTRPDLVTLPSGRQVRCHLHGTADMDGAGRPVKASVIADSAKGIL